MELQLDVIALAMTTLIGLLVGGMYRNLARFMEEQRQVNRANAEANRSMQRDVLYRYFHKAVELGESLTPEEYKHVADCAEAYRLNGGNGAGTVMWDRIREHAKIDTGRSGKQ